MEVYVGILDTKNFNFLGISDSEETLMNNFEKAWEEHRILFYDACEFSDIISNINIIKMPLNSIVRDYEIIFNGEQIEYKK